MALFARSDRLRKCVKFSSVYFFCFPSFILSNPVTHGVFDKANAEGNYGVMWPLESMNDVGNFVKTKPKHSHLIVVLSGELLTPGVIGQLETVKQVQGLLVLSTTAPLDQYSETSSFPQSNSSTAGEDHVYTWNIPNHDVLHHEYKWPMWSIASANASTLMQQARRNVAESTRFGLQMKQFMFGYKNAATCLKYQYCEPVGGHSVWGALPMPDTLTGRTVIMTLSRLDSISIFAGEAIGADSDMSGLVANLAALTTLAGIDNVDGPNPHGYRAVDPTKFVDPIVWAFFDAENWGYAGSTRFLHDWTKFNCVTGRCTAESFRKTFQSLSLDNIREIVEVRQVGAEQRDGSQKLFVHQHFHNYATPSTQTVLSVSSDLNTTVAHASTRTPGLPPSSTFTFLDGAVAAGKTSLANSIVVIADHDEHYSNPYYGSRFDTRKNVDLKILTDASTILARTLYAHATHLPAAEANFINVNASLVSAWLECVTMNSNCRLARTILPSLTSDKLERPSHYHGPFFDYAVSSLGKLVHDYMIYVTRNQSLDSTSKPCSDDSECQSTEACIVGKCTNSLSVDYHESYSVGIEPKAKGGWTIVDPKLDNWVEP